MIEICHVHFKDVARNANFNLGYLGFKNMVRNFVGEKFPAKNKKNKKYPHPVAYWSTREKEFLEVDRSSKFLYFQSDVGISNTLEGSACTLTGGQHGRVTSLPSIPVVAEKGCSSAFHLMA